MGKVMGCAPEKGPNDAAACHGKFIFPRGVFFGALLIFGVLSFAACGNGGSEPLESRRLVPHDAISLDGKTASESYLKISSTIDGEAAVSVTNGGHLTLKDATIWKSGKEESGSPTYGMSGGQVPPPQGDGNAGPPPPPPADEGGRDGGMPGGVMAGGLMPEGGIPGDTNPGPGATHAGVYAGSGGTVELSNVSIETTLGEGKGIYASGEGSSVVLVNGTITTDGSTADGVFATHRGAVSVENVTIITKGEHSSALSTYQGNGTVTAVGGTYTAFGEYSAGIYSASDISVTDVICKSISDNAAVVEGGSRIALKDSVLWSRNKGAVMIYQSFSENIPVKPAEFVMTGGSISAEEGPLFYVTNTTCNIYLKQADLFAASGILLEVLKGEWGVDIAWAKPTQGGTVTFVADDQVLSGDIVADEFSEITATLKNGAILTGAINTDGRAKAVNLTLDTSSSWHVTADSTLTGLDFSGGNSNGRIQNIVDNGHTVFYNKDASPALGGNIYDLPEGGKLMPK